METTQKNADGNSVAGSTTLSRTAVYASLQSFHSSTASNAATTQPFNENTKSSSSLLSFYSDISTIYHRTAPRLDGKNTSARPLGMYDISTRLSQRAITFTSNYYKKNSDNSVTKKKKKNKNADQVAVTSSFNISTAQRKRKRQNLVQRINFNRNNIDGDSSVRQTEQLNLEFILRLNQEWNMYIRNLLQLDNDAILCDNTTTVDVTTPGSNNNDHNKRHKHVRQVHQRIVTLQNDNCIEWVGAYVRVSHVNDSSNTNDGNSTTMSDAACQQQHEPSAVAQKKNASTKLSSSTKTIEGILISHSPNDWLVVPLVINTIACDDTITSLSNAASCDNGIVKILLHDNNDIHHNIDDDDQTQKQRHKQETAMISLLTKVKLPKKESSMVVTACVPLGKNMNPYAFLSNDQMKFLNIHLQSR